jgi:dTDP-4-amino-4,6-dideoxygalactose transaminase
LEQLDAITRRRHLLWHRYHTELAGLERGGWARLPTLFDYSQHNAHAFYLILADESVRARLIAHLRDRDILAVFHYLSLHRSPWFADKHDGRSLPNADRYTNCLLRLPLFHDLAEHEQQHVIDSVLDFFGAESC